MLSQKLILETLDRTPAPREHSFSPRGGETAATAPVHPGIKDEGKKITLKLRYVLLPSGDMTIAHDGSELPEGASWVD